MIRLTVALLALAIAVPVAGDAPSTWPGMPAMANYHLGLLRKGPTWSAQRTPATDSIQAGHMANIVRMSEEGILVAAGPLLDGGDLRGVFVFRNDSIAQIRSMVARDPAVTSGRLVMDLYPWFAPAGIGEPYQRMSRQPGYRDSMVRHPLVLLKAGPRASREPAREADSIQIAHVRGIFAGLASGELASAGPIAGAGDLRGVLVYRGDSTVARRRALDDPAVRSGRLAVEMHPWFAAWGTWPGDTVAAAR
jgi:uncharacterized protein YciI